jgi:phage gp16-like protein
LLDRKKLAVIHIVKKELALEDQDYRDILERVTGVRSARDLDEPGFRKLMHHFARSGYYRINPEGLTMRQKLYIKHLQAELGWHDEHLGHFLHKYYQKNTIAALTKKEGIKVIEALKNVRLHRQG